jgi:energy-converting hydrogenase Eha subunit A
MYIFGSIIALLLLIVLLNPTVLLVVHKMVTHGALSQVAIAKVYPTFSPTLVSIALILIDFIYLNMVLGIINLIINCSELTMFHLMERSPDFASYAPYVTILVPVIALCFFGLFRKIIGTIIIYSGYLLAHLLGLL